MVEIDLTAATDTSYKPNLNDVHRVLKEEVVGESESAMSLFTTWICSEENAMMSGPRSSGKTFVTDHVMSFVGNIGDDETGQGYILTAGSDKSGWYEAEQINRSKYVVVLELNKIPKEMQEILKDWGEGKDSSYKTVTMINGVRKTITKKLERRPFVFCLADEDEMKVDTQLASRLTLIRTDDSAQQSIAIMKHQAKLSKLPYNPLTVDNDTKIKLGKHIKTLPKLKGYEWKNPAADKFVDSIPPFFTDCRRDFPKYLKNVIGICRFHWKDRIKLSKDGKEMYFITPEDMYYNHIIFGSTLISSALKCNNIEREMIKILGASVEQLKRADVQKELKKQGRTLSAQMVARHLNTLADLGYLEKETAGDKKSWQYRIGQMFNDFMFEVDWTKIIEHTKTTMTELYPEIAEEYIKKYCTNPVVHNPFTNEEIKLNELEVDKLNAGIGILEQTEPKGMTDAEAAEYYKSRQVKDIVQEEVEVEWIK